jgi:hypothetical protein
MGTSRYVRARQLMTRETLIDAPFTGGIATDLEYFQLAPQQTVAAQDLIAPNGIATQRHGWTYDGTTAEHGANILAGVARNGFVLSGQTRTITTDFSTSPVMIHNAAGAGTAIFTSGVSGVTYIPRCIYRDELIICAQDGIHPLLRYSGTGAASSSVNPANLSVTAGKAILTTSAGTFNAATTAGAFVGVGMAAATASPAPRQWFRVLERNSSTSLTLEGVRTASGFTGFADIAESAVGFTWPAVSVYSAGTVTVAAGTATGTGTKWLAFAASGTAVEFGGDALLTLPPSGTNAQVGSVDSVVSDVSLNVQLAAITDTPYAYLRRCPFKDAAAHRGSLWGTGVNQYPDRVYVFPPGWNASLPPGYTEPYDPVAATAGTSANANDFLASYVDVPSPYDGDSNIAILPSAGPLLVLKRYSVYGVFGSYPSFQVSLIPGGQGAGCDDIRSAISVPEGQFWAGQLGVYTYRNGQVVELTHGRINREWRARFRSGVQNIVCGVVANHLLVRAVGVGTDDVTYVYDLVRNAWVSKFSNLQVNYTWRSKVGTEQERLLAVAPAGVRICDLGPAFDVANTAGVTIDANSGGPRMQATTGPALAQAAGIDGEAKMLDVVADVNLYDSSAPASTLSFSVTHSGGLENTAQRTKTLGTITADTLNLPKRALFRDVNRSGRLHSLSMDMTLNAATAKRAEIPEVTITWRDVRSQT